MSDNKSQCRKYYWSHKEECNTRSRKYYLDHKNRLNEISKKRAKIMYDKYRDQYLYERKLYRYKLKVKCLIAYGGDPPKCACCKESYIDFLSIDHINGGGNKHRELLGLNTSTGLYRWLIKNNFPKGFQVLCFNCNMAKGFYGICPHQKLKD